MAFFLVGKAAGLISTRPWRSPAVHPPCYSTQFSRNQAKYAKRIDTFHPGKAGSCLSAPDFQFACQKYLLAYKIMKVMVENKPQNSGR
jgi:hypothetical protein